ncbi:MAG TPA: hypothetical protein VH350_13785 [Candidatus Sulfotelmatobacter sp.]|nr:hypothetical protein [Candidatus Sulfotelmatobacter sp.]
MRIDEARKNGGAAEIMDGVTFGRYLIGGDNGVDSLSFNQDGGRTDSVRSDYPACDEGLRTQNIGSLYDCAY